jgi:hypothetical protein
MILPGIIGALTGLGIGSNPGFAALEHVGNGGTQALTGAGFAPDALLYFATSLGTDRYFFDSVRGANKVKVIGASAEQTSTQYLTSFDADGITLNNAAGENLSGQTYMAHTWKRAASSGFDVVATTGTGVARTVSHGLSTAPRLIMAFRRDMGAAAYAYHATSGAGYKSRLDSITGRSVDTAIWNNTVPTSSVFSLGASSDMNILGATYFFWLFADVPGVQQITSFTTDGSGDGTLSLTFKPGMLILIPQDASNNRLILDSTTNAAYGDNWRKYSSLNNATNTTAPATFAAVTSSGVTFTGAGGLTASETYLVYATAA